MKELRQKWKVKLIFRGAWNSLMAWLDWPPTPLFYDRPTPLAVLSDASVCVYMCVCGLRAWSDKRRVVLSPTASCVERSGRRRDDGHARRVDDVATLGVQHVTTTSTTRPRHPVSLSNSAQAMFWSSDRGANQERRQMRDWRMTGRAAWQNRANAEGKMIPLVRALRTVPKGLRKKLEEGRNNSKRRDRPIGYFSKMLDSD